MANTLHPLAVHYACHLPLATVCLLVSFACKCRLALLVSFSLSLCLLLLLLLLPLSVRAAAFLFSAVHFALLHAFVVV